jgi:hypothetical protein
VDIDIKNEYKTMEIKRFDHINEEATNGQLLRLMVQLSNNSQLTNTTAVMLSQTLSEAEMNELIRWMRHAEQETQQKINMIKNKRY